LCDILRYSVAAETEAEHIRVDLAMDEAIDLKRSAATVCYNRDFVCLHFSTFYIYVSFVARMLLSSVHGLVSIVHVVGQLYTSKSVCFFAPYARPQCLAYLREIWRV